MAMGNTHEELQCIERLLKNSAMVEAFDKPPFYFGDFNSTRFRSRKNEERFARHFAPRKVVSERQMLLSEFNSDRSTKRWGEIAERLHLSGLLGYSGKAVPELVKEFYANVYFPSETRIESWVRGKTVIITPDTFASFFGMETFAEPIPFPVLTSEEIYRELCMEPVTVFSGPVAIGSLKLAYSNLSKIISKNYRPTFRDSTVSREQMNILYVIGKEIRYDHARKIFDYLRDFIVSSRPHSSLPFGVFLTSQFVEAGVSLQGLPHQELDKPLGLSTSSRAEGQRQGGGLAGRSKRKRTRLGDGDIAQGGTQTETQPQGTQTCNMEMSTANCNLLRDMSPVMMQSEALKMQEFVFRIDHADAMAAWDRHRASGSGAVQGHGKISREGGMEPTKESYKRENEELQKKITKMEKALEEKDVEIEFLRNRAKSVLLKEAKSGEELHGVRLELSSTDTHELEQVLDKSLINDELNEARKELINGLRGMADTGDIGIKSNTDIMSPELWNFYEGRKASLKEAIAVILDMIKMEFVQNKKLEHRLKVQMKKYESIEEEKDKLKDDLGNVKNELSDKIEDYDHADAQIKVLTTKLHVCNDELQDARKEAVQLLRNILNEKTTLRIKRLGEVDVEPFQELCLAKCSDRDDLDERSASLCSAASRCTSWQNEVENPEWQPYKKINEKEIVDEDDVKLQKLREECGDMAYEAVKDALLEMNECNASGRYVVPEIWIPKEDRRATLKEILQYVIKKWQSNKRKRKRS